MTTFKSRWIKKKKKNQTIVIWFPGLNDTYSHDEQIENGLFEDCNLYLMHPSDYHPKENENDNPHLAENMKEYFSYLNFDINNDLLPYKNCKWIIYSHSTGSLLAIRYLQCGKYRNFFDGLILDDPFLTTKGFLNNIVFSFPFYVPLCWKISNFLIKFNKKCQLASSKESKIKKIYHTQGYSLSTKGINDYSAFVLACHIEQYEIYNNNCQKKYLLNNLPCYVLLAKDKNTVLDYEKNKKYCSYISKNLQFLDVKSVHQCIRPSNKQFGQLFANINTFVKSIKSKKLKKILEERNNFQKKDNQTLIFPSICFHLFLFTMMYYFKRLTFPLLHRLFLLLWRFYSRTINKRRLAI